VLLPQRGLTDAQLTRYDTGANGYVSNWIFYGYDVAGLSNGNGRLGYVTAPHGQTTYQYTVEGHVKSEQHDFTVAPEGQPIQHAVTARSSYDLLGNVTQMVHP